MGRHVLVLVFLLKWDSVELDSLVISFTYVASWDNVTLLEKLLYFCVSLWLHSGRNLTTTPISIWS
jgi:hypothetical protein